jgi:hypothetical protein
MDVLWIGCAMRGRRRWLSFEAVMMLLISREGCASALLYDRIETEVMGIMYWPAKIPIENSEKQRPSHDPRHLSSNTLSIQPNKLS